jgi:DNA-binding beta-propeller fold protein YncE
MRTVSPDGAGSMSTFDSAACVSTGPEWLALSPDDSKLYMNIASSSAVDYMNTADTSTIGSVDLSSYIYSQGGKDVAFKSDSKKVYVLGSESVPTQKVIVINAATKSVEEEILLPDCDAVSLVYKPQCWYFSGIFVIAVGPP